MDHSEIIVPKIIVLGEALIDLFAEPSKSLYETRSLFPMSGGATANVAATIGLLGGEVAYIAKVGEDAFGQLLQDTLNDCGVNIKYFVADKTAPTMIAIVASPSNGEQQFILYNGANELLKPDDIPYELIKKSEVFIFCSVTLSTGGCEAAFKAAEIAENTQSHVIFDVNLRPNLWSDIEEARSQINIALNFATIVKLNESEMQFLTGSEDVEKGIMYLLDMGVKLCFVSLGEKGSYFATKSVSGYVPSLKVKVKNTTGSGDAFVAGLAYQLRLYDNSEVLNLSSDDLTNITYFANACGAIVATERGGINRKLNLQTVNKLIEEQIK